MKNIKTLSLTLLLSVTAITQTTNNDDQNNTSMTVIDAGTAPAAFALDGAADILTFGHAHQTQTYVDRNSKNGNPSSQNVTFGEAVLSPVTVPVAGVTGQGKQEVDRNFRDTSTTNADAKAAKAKAKADAKAAKAKAKAKAKADAKAAKSTK